MNPLLNELKIRAKLLHNTLQDGVESATVRAARCASQQRWSIPDQWQLQHCLNIVAVEAGFTVWEHARHVLGGEAQVGDDMGDFWYDRRALGLTNQWFASYAEAQARLQLQPNSYLLPYRRQFFLVEAAYLADIKLDPALWPIGRDLVAAYGSDAWMALCRQRLQTSRDTASRAVPEVRASAAERERVMTSFVADGRLLKIPQTRKKRLVILEWLVDQLQMGRRYPEQELNRFLLQFHEDYATLRREFIANRLMAREQGAYWRL